MKGVRKRAPFLLARFNNPPFSDSIHLKKSFRVKWFLLAFFFLLHSAAQANIGMINYPGEGQMTGSPFISRHCVITKEELSVDLRPMENLQPAIVNATYYFTSDTVSDHITLILVAANLSRADFSITLDDQPVHGDTVAVNGLPQEWLALHAADTDPYWQTFYDERTTRYIRFVIAIDSGAHVLNATYSANTARDIHFGYAMHHRFAYALSPAKDWKAYNNLQLEVFLPEGWAYSSNLELDRNGDQLSGQWDQLPAQYLYVTTGIQEVNATDLQNGYLYALWTIIAVIFFRQFAKRIRGYFAGTTSESAYWLFPLAAVPISVVAMTVVFLARVWFLKLFYGNQLSPALGFGDGYAVMAAAYLMFLALFGTYVLLLVLAAIASVLKTGQEDN